MKTVQNNAYWRELLDYIPEYVLIFKIDEHEKAELVFANRNWEPLTGFKADELLLRSISDVQIKKILENVIDRVAQHSRNEISDSDCTSVWQTKTGEQITFHFTYRAFKISSSPNFHISVLFTVNQIERINGLNAVIEQDLITESMAMKALVQRLPGIVQTQSAILIQGEPYTGKSTLVKFLLASSELLGWKQAFSLEEIQLKLQENEEGAFCIILEEIHLMARKTQEQLLQTISDLESRAMEYKIVATTVTGIDKLLDNGDFIPDLYYKLGAHTLHVPPLRFRKEDVQMFISRKVDQLKNLLGYDEIRFSEECQQYIRKSEWPENFKSLQKFIGDSLAYLDGNTIELADEYRVEEGDQSSLFNEDLSDIKSFDSMMKHYLKEVLKKTGGKIYGRDGAAHLLKLKPTTLQSKLKKLGIK